MGKVLINLEVPAISESYDVYIPTFLNITKVAELLAKAVAELSDQRYVSSGHELLCHKENGYVMRVDKTFEEYGILNGDHLIFL